MFESYKDIFDARAASYHQAMLECPRARAEELTFAVQLVDPRPGDVVVDAPSGGGYLRDHLPAGVRLVAVETSRGFLDAASSGRESSEPQLLCDAIHRTPLAAGSVDAVVNLAGLHHEADKGAFYREAFRVLRPGGVLGIADVRVGSPVDRFLNGFVDASSSMGHDGRFLDDTVAADLEGAGFEVTSVEPKAYPWRFANEAELGRYCRLMFGIDKCDDDEVGAGVREILGIEHGDGECHMPWELLFARARKPG